VTTDPYSNVEVSGAATRLQRHRSARSLAVAGRSPGTEAVSGGYSLLGTAKLDQKEAAIAIEAYGEKAEASEMSLQ